MKKMMSRRPVLHFILLCSCGLLYPACSASDTTAPAEVPLQNRQQALELVKAELPKPIPEDYVIPTYITSGLPLAQVYDTLARRYPMFYGFQDEQYLDSIVRYPQRYLQLNLESKAIRRYYDPNSRY